MSCLPFVKIEVTLLAYYITFTLFFISALTRLFMYLQKGQEDEIKGKKIDPSPVRASNSLSRLQNWPGQLDITQREKYKHRILD